MKRILPLILLFLITIFSAAKSDDKLEKKVKQHFVQVEFDVLKNESPFINKDSYDEFEDYVENKKKYRTYGIPINENTIIINHISIASERFSNIKIKTSTGEEFAATLDGYGLNRDLQTLKIEGKLSYPKWKPIDLKKITTPIFEAFLAYREIYPYVMTKDITSEIEATPFFNNEVGIHALDEPENSLNISLLTNKKGEPLGVQARSFYKFKDKCSLFSPSEIKSINLEDLKAKEDLLMERIHKEIFLVQINFRQKTDANNYNEEVSSGLAGNSPEAKIFGVLMNNKGDLLLPFNIPLEKIKDIETIEVRTPEKTYTAIFKGAYATIGATIITCEEFKGKQAKFDFQSPIEENLLYSFSLLWNSPDDYQIEVCPNNLYGRSYSINDRVYHQLKHQINISETIFFNQDLEICGINTKYKNTENLKEEEANNFIYSGDRINYLSIFDIKDEILNPEKFLDNRAIQLNRQDALAPTWLGVIVQSPSTALLEHFKVLDKTKNGLIGLLVTQVYADSPGQKIGLKPLDILLSVTYEDSNHEFEFIKSNDNNANLYGQYDPNGQPTMELFPIIRNEVTNVLNKLETGKTVILKYIHDGKIVTAPFKLEKAPKDFANAAKYVDEDLGLHVKDVTFEVRESLHLKENETGVIISEVEQGKACDIAQIHNYFIILKVDKTAITSVDQFKEIITSKKAAGVTEFSFTVLFLGKTSLIKVNLKN